MASRSSTLSPIARMRLNISRHDSPASTSRRVRLLATRVLLPLEPLASTVIRTIRLRIRLFCVDEAAELQRLSEQLRLRVLEESAPALTPQPSRIDHANQQRA